MIIDDGQSEVATPSGSETLSSANDTPGRSKNALAKSRIKPPKARDQMYSTVTSLMQSMVNEKATSLVAASAEADFELRRRQIDLYTIKFLDGKSMEDIVEMKQKLAYILKNLKI